MKPDKAIMAAEILKVQTLYFDNVTNQGAEDTRPANEAPAPMVTNSAGSAQHIKVPTEVNSDNVGSNVCLDE